MKKVLLLRKGFKILVECGKKVSTHLGIIDTKKAKVGQKIKTHLGNEFFVVEPNLRDMMEKLKRGAQVILPKDMATIIAYTGLRPNWKVLDAGSGSAFSSIFLANFLEKGKVITCENDERFYRIALENIKFVGMKNIVLKKCDVKNIKEKNFNLILLDMENSDRVIEEMDKKLLIGGHIVVYSPTIDHMIKNLKSLKKTEKYEVQILENIIREWQYEKTLRPKTKGLMHTGFLIIARKVSE